MTYVYVVLNIVVGNFVNCHTYSYWRAVYFTTRAIQDRINGICLIIRTNAEKNVGRIVDGKIMSDYSERAAELVDTRTRLIRVSHTFLVLNMHN